jgi:hypothetical protein
MSSQVSVGHLLPDRSRIRADSPSVQSGGRAVADWSVPDWHYLTDITVEWSVEADIQGLAKDCGLSGDARVGALLVWRSGRTNLQGAGPIVGVRQGQNTLEALLPGRDLGGTVTVEARVLLLEADRQAQEFSPWRPGSLLWHEEQKVVLEGSGGRFPTVATDFTDSVLPGGRDGIWYLRIIDKDLGASATQALRLYLNTANKDIRSLLDNPSGEASIATMRFLRYDTTRQLLKVALTHDEFDDRTKYGQETLGDVLVTLLRIYLPGRDIDQLRAEYPLNPAEIDAEVLAAAWRDSW